jgi:hypothetical protein
MDTFINWNSDVLIVCQELSLNYPGRPAKSYKLLVSCDQLVFWTKKKGAGRIFEFFSSVNSTIFLNFEGKKFPGF